jgi:hypothetical protein
MTISTTSTILTLSNRYTKNALNHPQSRTQVQHYACATKYVRIDWATNEYGNGSIFIYRSEYGVLAGANAY